MGWQGRTRTRAYVAGTGSGSGNVDGDGNGSGSGNVHEDADTAANAPTRSLPAVPPPGWRDGGGRPPGRKGGAEGSPPPTPAVPGWKGRGDRKSTRLNSSHVKISYAVFCLKNKKKK